jgi:hypothetical protein
MRALSIQVQPARSSALDVERVSAVFTEIAGMADVVQRHQFDRGYDDGPYLNFTFGTTQAAALWRVVWERLYEDDLLGPHMRIASMAMCSSEQGWDDYVLLHHFDPTVPLGPASSLTE